MTNIVDPKAFEVQEKLVRTDLYKFYKITSLATGKKYIAKIFLNDFEKFSREDAIKLFQDIYTISRINHPNILKLFGFSSTNFKKKSKATVIYENTGCYTLSQVVYPDDSYPENPNLIDFSKKLDDTKKLIIIHGIASAMSFLHSHNIIIRSLTTDNFFIDEKFNPILYEFQFSKELNSEEGQFQGESKIIGKLKYLAPEVLKKLKYSKSSDVYNFSMLVYEILTAKEPFKKGFKIKKDHDFIKKLTKHNIRPELKKNIPKCYHELIEKCWSQEPKKRPTFDFIVNELRTNPAFITDKINKDEYFNAIKEIDESTKSFEPSQKFQDFDNILKPKIHLFKNLENEYKRKIFPDAEPLCDLERFEFRSKDLFHKETNTIVDYKISDQEINQFTRNEIKCFCRKVNIMSQINHPAINRLIGFSLVDFENKPRPVIITELSEVKTFVVAHFRTIDDTQKLCLLYGIASGMAFLHSHNIIHRNLTFMNIIYTKIFGMLFPKITGFELSKEIKNDTVKKNKTIKGTPLTIAPEVYLNQGYSKASDVYSFSFIAFIFARRIFYNEQFDSPKEIKKKFVEKGYRPHFEEPIANCYRSLIERCWSQDPSSRPTFDEIVHELKTNPEFITGYVNKDDFLKYVKFIDEYPTIFDPKRKIKQLDDILKFKLKSFPDIKPSLYLSSMLKTEINNISVDEDYLVDSDFDIIHNFFINDGFYKKFSKVSKKQNSRFYLMKESYNSYDMFFKYDLINFSRELNISLQLDHPSILKFCGISLFVKSIEMVYEYVSKNTLEDLLKLERVSNSSSDTNIQNLDEYSDYKEEEEEEENKPTKLTDTNKLIIIYGIAAGMSYLHFNNILHRDLKPSNIFVDKFSIPKITGFHISKEIDNDMVIENKKIKGTPVYLAPEIYLHKGYSKSSDVYSFSLIVYEIVTGKKTFETMVSPREIKEFVADKNLRPEIDNSTPKCYKRLIEKCWSQNPSSRPSFDAIIKELKTNKDFINENNVDKRKYQKYIKFIDNSLSTFKRTKKIQQLDDYVNLKLHKFNEINTKINFKSIDVTETNDLLLDHDFIDINKYEPIKEIIKHDYYKIQTVQNKETKEIYFAEIYYKDILSIFEYDIIYFCPLVNFLMESYHPALLNFIGYSPTDFKNRPRPIILMENASNGTLEEMIEVGKKDLSSSIFNDTKKLINIFGIASCLAFLHSKDVIFGYLRSKNIFLDDYLFPKIGLLNNFIKISDHPIKCLPDNVNKIEYAKQKDFYKSPELWISGYYSSASDVYAFGMIAYEIITNSKPYLNYKSFDINNFNNALPTFPDFIPECYRNLIRKCWLLNPHERPTFDEIIYHLKTNKEFINDKIDNVEYQNYIKLIESYQESDNTQIEDIIKTQNQTFRKIKIDFNKLRESSRLNFSVNMGSISLDPFEKQSKIGSGSFGVAYKINEKKSGNVYAAKVSKYEVDQTSEDIIMNLAREIEIFSELNHSSILRFIGYCPKNFKGKSKPVIISELAENKSLDTILELERLGRAHNDWDDTKKLINIYGIAAGMLYMHRNNIIHRDLKPGNIFLDENLYPKIADFGLSKNISDQEYFDKKFGPVSSGFKGTYSYCSPEILSDYKYTKSGDVYAFAMIVYEIVTNEIPFKGFNIYQLILQVGENDYRPPFNFPIPYCYKKLIEKCWQKEEYKRMDFEHIVNLLEKDSSFITKNVDQKEYFNYISYVKEYQQESIIIDMTQSTDKSLQNRVEEPEKDFLLFQDHSFLDLSKFERDEIFNKEDTYKICKLIDKETKKYYSAQMSMLEIHQLSKEDLDKISKEIDIISHIKHPTILKFIGFSPIDFKKEWKPVIVMEHASNGTLKQLFEVERNNTKIRGWDDTKKLINIYGIASGMSYLHSHNIIHRCLKPANIYLDDILFPKIGDYGLSNRFYNADIMTHQSISGQKATPIYSAPEVLQYNKFSKKSDVYAFSFIVYEMLSNEVPFAELDNANKIYNEVVNKSHRPKIKKEIPLVYVNLIEKCWSQNPDERPSFEEIAYCLRNQEEFITQDIRREDYFKYIDLIDAQMKENPLSDQIVVTLKNGEIDEINSSSQTSSPKHAKIDELNEKHNNSGNIKIDESPYNLNFSSKTMKSSLSENQKTGSLEQVNVNELSCNQTKMIPKEVKIDEADFINESQNEISFFTPEPTNLERNKNEELSLIDEYIQSNNPKDLMIYLDRNCDQEQVSSVFDRCFSISKEFYYKLCEEGIKHNNAVAHHKYAILLIFDTKEKDIEAYNKAKSHLEESIKQGNNISYFTYSRLCYEIFKDNESAFLWAKEGSKRSEKHCLCLEGFYTAHGIGTKKDFDKGVSIILKSGADYFIDIFSTDIGIYYSKLQEGENSAFYWFEKAFNIKKTKATINNYGLCFLKGIGFPKNIEKAIEIFKIGNEKGYSTSMYLLGLIFEQSDLKFSLQMYKKAAGQGHLHSLEKLGFLLLNEDLDLAIKYYKKAVEKGSIIAQEFLAKKYSKENDWENTYIYFHSLIEKGNYSVPFNCALSIYKSKYYKQAFNIFSLLSQRNHPISIYFLGMMKYRGEGCQKNIDESYKIMKFLSENGIDKATEFIENHFNIYKK